MSKWIEKPLGQLADFVMGQSPDSAAVSEQPGGLPFLQGCAEFGPRNPEPKFYVDPPLRVAPEGSSLISVRAPVGTMNVADQSYGIGRGLAAIIGRTRSNLFLRYAIELNTSWLHRRSQGSTFLAVGSEDLRTLPIKLSEDAETCEAAAKMIALVDTEIEATEALIAKQERVRAGLMQDLFTRGVDEHGQLRPPREEVPHLYHQTKLGWLPLGWEVRTIQTAVRNIIDYRGVPPPKADSGVPLITAKNVRFGYLDPEPREYIADADFKSWMRRGLPLVGDVLFTTEAPLGNVAQIPDYKLALGQRTLTLQPNLDFVGQQYLKWTLMSERTQERIKRLQSGSTATGIQSRTFRTILLELPTIDEQNLIVDKLNVADAIEDALFGELSKLRLQKSGLMQDLLSGEVSVTPLFEKAAA